MKTLLVLSVISFVSTLQAEQTIVRPSTAVNSCISGVTSKETVTKSVSSWHANKPLTLEENRKVTAYILGNQVSKANSTNQLNIQK